MTPSPRQRHGNNDNNSGNNEHNDNDIFESASAPHIRRAIRLDAPQARARQSAVPGPALPRRRGHEEAKDSTSARAKKSEDSDPDAANSDAVLRPCGGYACGDIRCGSCARSLLARWRPARILPRVACLLDARQRRLASSVRVRLSRLGFLFSHTQRIPRSLSPSSFHSPGGAYGPSIWIVAPPLEHRPPLPSGADGIPSPKQPRCPRSSCCLREPKSSIFRRSSLLHFTLSPYSLSAHPNWSKALHGADLPFSLFGDTSTSTSPHRSSSVVYLCLGRRQAAGVG
ncbi:hypothetical protein MSAN_00312800 [Mycena sanguinolenta]|uniref:Uncharacterized protein n=1 Tax=Mycena sanguinolenta TaxID=230812 RepID=A0A8H6ZCD8_9AGAR|nr:hypothetical protein MSAN_00312800 [Mycena sanguinolenta]